MLSDAEKKDLVNQDALPPNERAKINYRVAQKVKTKLLEIKDINEALRLLPEKNARKILNDDMVNDVFTIAEEMIRILGYGPLQIDNNGIAYTTQALPTKNDSDKQSMTFVVTAERADYRDAARKKLIDDHIAVLNHLMSQNFGLYLSEAPGDITDEPISGNIDPVKANAMLFAWGRPRIRTFKERFVFHREVK